MGYTDLRIGPPAHGRLWRWGWRAVGALAFCALSVGSASLGALFTVAAENPASGGLAGVLVVFMLACWLCGVLAFQLAGEE